MLTAAQLLELLLETSAHGKPAENWNGGSVSYPSLQAELAGFAFSERTAMNRLLTVQQNSLSLCVCVCLSTANEQEGAEGLQHKPPYSRRNYDRTQKSRSMS